LAHLPWYVAALGAALVWGLHYPLIEQALQRVSLPAVLLLTALPMVLVAPFFARELGADWQTLAALPWRERLPILAVALTSLVATVLLFFAIDSKNATLASLIEISYPVFVAAFAFLLFRQEPLNTGALIGAALVFAGVAVIVATNR
jgi:drug/metabolite transporter (DMT)-like permease